MSSRQPFAARDYYRDPRRRAKSLGVRLASRITRRVGLDLELRHWYSPIPQVDQIDPGYWHRSSAMPGVAPFDTSAMLDFVEAELAPAIAEFSPPRKWSGRPNEYFVENGLFQAGDADVLYAMIRRFRPRRVFEFGAGFSTLVSAQACAANRRDGHDVEFVSCDPYALAPSPGQVPGLDELRSVRAEDVAFTELQTLERDDILFVDSSHTVRAGGDVTHLFGEVVPRLAAGVFVHVHDIFLPWPYPRDWISHNHWYWAEQDLVRALLTGNNGLQVLWAGYAVHSEQLDRFTRAVPNYRRGAPPPLSLWMRVVR